VPDYGRSALFLLAREAGGRSKSVVQKKLIDSQPFHTTGAAEALLGSGMGGRAILFCLLGLLLTAVITMMIAPQAVTRALSLIL
jgi:hypothetical protein